MWWTKTKEKIIKSNNKEIVDWLIERQTDDVIVNNDLSKLVQRWLNTWVSWILEDTYAIKFRFNDGSEFQSWNANKDYSWLSSRNIITTINWKEIKYHWKMRVNEQIMTKLMLATYENYSKELDYKLPKEIEEALILSNKAERFTYEVNYMQTLIKEKLEDLIKSKKKFKEKYWSDIIEILSNIKQ